MRGTRDTKDTGGVGGAGRLGDAFLTPGSSSFTAFLAAHRPGLLPTRPPLPPGARAAPDAFPHGTTILALTWSDGVLVAGDRRATMGNLIAQRDLEKVHPADDHTAIAFAGTVGLAADMVRLYRVELAHFEKVEGIPMTLAAKATRLSAMLRQNLDQAMQGLAVVPLLAGYDPRAPEGRRGRIFGFDVAGGVYEKTGFYAEGSGSPYARGSLKKLFRPGLPRREAVLTALHALYDAADDDSATGGPDLHRRIYPVVALITEDGFERLAQEETADLSRVMVAQRRTSPDGPTATP